MSDPTDLTPFETAMLRLLAAVCIEAGLDPSDIAQKYLQANGDECQRYYEMVLHYIDLFGGE